jgi:dTMP kinase
MSRRRGLFIVLEGPDKSGKSTQARLIAESLGGRTKVLHTREPGGTPIAEAVRTVLLNPALKVCPVAELLLYEASRAQHVDEMIAPALSKGMFVVCERFTMSTDAYQGVGRGLGLKTTGTLNAIASAGVKPDLTILIDVPESEFVRRDTARALDRLEREKASFRRRVRAGYLRLAKSRPRTIVIDGRLSPGDVHRLIMAAVQRIRR